MPQGTLKTPIPEGAPSLANAAGRPLHVVYGITNTMLANSLKELEADGLVERTQYAEMPVRVEYRLTPTARTLIPILMELKDWGEQNL